MKNFVQYHNAFKQGPLQLNPAGRFSIFAKKSINHIVGHRVWLISGHGKTSPKHYQLEYTFVVDEVAAGAPNRAFGRNGHRFAPAIPLNQLEWFKGFLEHQSRFSLGIREISDEHLAHLEALRAKQML